MTSYLGALQDAIGPETGMDLDDYPLVVSEFVEIDASGCWIWTGRTHKGRAYIPHQGRNWLVYRLTYRLAYGELPEYPNSELDHICREPKCVNPRHVRPVTRAENAARRYALMTHCRRGHEFTEANTYTTAGRRSCRKCQALHVAAYKERRRAS